MRASTEAAMVGTGAPSSAASCTVQLPVPFIDAESRIRSIEIAARLRILDAEDRAR